MATAVAGISGFAVVIIPGKIFGDDALVSEFLAYWGSFFAITGAITGLMQETTRAVTAAQEKALQQAPTPAKPATPTPGAVTSDTPTPSPSAPAAPEPTSIKPAPKSQTYPIVVGAWIALITMILVALTAPLWAPRILSQQQFMGTVLMAVGLASYTIQATITGLISAARLWNQYALLIVLDSMSRMVLAIIAWIVGWKLVAFLVITVVGAASWLVLVLCSSQVRQALRLLADVPTKQFLSRVGFAMAASGATAVLITGFPTLVKLTHPQAAMATSTVSISVVMYGVILTRAPLLVPLQQFLSALVVRFVQHRDRPLHALSQPFLLVWSIGILGAIAAWLIGPWLLLLIDQTYIIPGWLLALFTIDAACTASLMITGAATMSIEKHQYYLLGWALATLVGIGILASPLPLETGAWLALSVGPLCGLVVHMVGIFSARNPHGSRELQPQ